MTDRLHFELKTPHIGVLNINHPERRNAMKADMWKALPDILNKIAKTDGLKVLILRGEGGHFCAGADISEFESLYSTADNAAKTSEAISKAFEALATFPLPVIAAIRGSCVGGGAGLALCCDIRIASDDVKFAVTPAKLGLAYPFAQMQRLIEIVGMAEAKDILFTAKLMDAETAHATGLLQMVTDDPDEAAMAHAQRIASLSGASMRMMKAMFKSYTAGQRGETRESQTQFAKAFSGDDFKEGYAAFLEKRKPNF